MYIPELKHIEWAIRHPGDHVTLARLPGESPSSLRRRSEAWAIYKLLKHHNPDMPLPSEGLAPKGFIRNQTKQTNTMNENNGAAPAQEVPKDDLMAMLAQMQKQLAELSKRNGGRPKGSKNKPKYVNPFPGFQYRERKVKNRGGLGGVVEAIRHEQRIPSAVVAERGGFNRGMIPMIEAKGDIDLGIKYLAKVAKGLGMKGSELLAKVEEQEAAKV